MKKKPFQKGKTFYSLLGLLVVFINVPILIALLFTQNTLARSHEALQTMLGAAQEAQMQLIQDVNPGRNHVAQLSTLRESPILSKLGGTEMLEYGAELEEAERILLSVTPAHSDHGVITTYLYFTRSGYLMDSSRPGGDASDTADPRIFSGLVPGYTDVPRTFLYSADVQGGEAHAIYTASVFPDVIFIFDIYFPEYPTSSRPDMSLSQDYTAGLKDVELCYYDSYGNVRIISGDGTLISQYDYNTLGPEENGSFSFRYNGHFYLCHSIFKEHTMTKFALFCRDEIAEEQHRTSILLWVSGGVLLAAFLACAFFYTRRAYKPISSLVSRLDRNGDASPLRDEFAVLNQAIDTLDDRLNRGDRLLEKYYLLRVLRGQKADTLEDYRGDWLEDREGRFFAVAALRVDEFRGGDLYDEPLVEQTVTAFLHGEGWDFRTVWDGGFLYLVLRLPGDVGDDALLAAFRRLQRHCGDAYLSVYLSEIHPCVRELRRCYSEAMAVSEYYIANEKISIVANPASTPKAARGNASPDFSQLRKLSDCVTTLSAGDALAAFDDLTFQLVRAGGQPLRAESDLYSLLVNTIALAVYDVDLPGDVGKAAIQRSIDQIRAADGVAQLRLRLEECLQTLSRRSDAQEYHVQRFEKIREYIQTHYSDPNLDSAFLAEHFHMSPSAITRLFKKYNQTGFLEYVHQTRVQKATELLQTTDLPISEISARVGYTNAATMSRAFKAHANSTPSMVRKRAQDEEAHA